MRSKTATLYRVARPRAYQPQKVLETAKELFWQHGYEAVTVEDLERATGLSRSSLYLGYGAKRDLFEAVLDYYLSSFISPLFAAVEAPGADLAQARRFFAALRDLFGRPLGQRGCLMVNSIAELSKRDPLIATRGAAFAERYRAGFGNAMRRSLAAGAMTRKQATERVDLLVSATFGMWALAQIHPAAAVRACTAIGNEIAEWSAANQRQRPVPR